MPSLLPSIIRYSCILLIPIVSGVVRLEDERSSFVSLKQGTCLQGHVIQTKQVSSFINCAQHCLANGKCKSVNFKKKGICELNAVSPEEGHVHSHLVSKGDVTLGWWISYTTKKNVFTSLNGQGRHGPSSTDGYKQTNLQGTVNLTNGIQYWETPESGNYIIEAVGGSGANGTCSLSGCTGWSLGGKGAKMRGSFPLKKGTRLKILVGQQGLCKSDTLEAPGGGGGGTFVSLDDDTPLIVAGGGGGGGITLSGTLNGDPGQTSTNGSRYGGTDGNGGRLYDSATKSFVSSPAVAASAGSGFYNEGQSGYLGTGAKSFINGGTGGSGNSFGGFGGGGFGISKSPGGGGGYSGGGVIINDTAGGSAGGGGSFNGGSEQDNESGVNQGDGRVTIILAK